MAKKTVSIVGLGYVGLPLAILCAKKGYEVHGLDTDKHRVDKTNQGVSHIHDEYLIENIGKVKIHASISYEPVKDSDAVIVCVPTPVDEKHIPDLSYVESSARSICPFLKKGQLIVIESTISPGTVEKVVQPLLEKTGLKAGADFFLAHCPERIDPGNKKWHIEDIPRVVGGVTPEATKAAAEFYRSILNAQVTELNSVKAAEAVKIMENTFRDINIAFINEMAKSFDKFGIDITEVIKGASTKPFAFMAHYPGAGVGGHCISVDPYYLIEEAKTYGFDHQFLTLARKINNSMPDYTVELLAEELNSIGKSIKGTKIAMLGLAYKANVDDIRESPSLEVRALLKKKGALLSVFDPFILKESDAKTLDECIKGKEAIVLVTDHAEFRKVLTPDNLGRWGIKVVIDGRNCLDMDGIRKKGIIYKGIGR